MKRLITTVAIIFASLAYAQVGIGTDTPNAMLEVAASGDSTKADGIIIPKITLEELTQKGDQVYNTAHTGTMIYITDITGGDNLLSRTNVTTTGFFFFDGSAWQNIKGYNGSPTITLVDNTITRAALTGDVNVPSNSNTTTISNNAVTTNKIADNAVTGTKIANLAVVNAKIGLKAVKDINIDDNAVNSAKIQDGTIATVDLADNAVNSAKILNGTIATVDLADNAVTGTKIANLAVTNAKIGLKAVKDINIDDNAVNSAKIQDGTIATVDLADNAVTPDKLSHGANGTTLRTINGNPEWAGPQIINHNFNQVFGTYITFPATTWTDIPNSQFTVNLPMNRLVTINYLGGLRLFESIDDENNGMTYIIRMLCNNVEYPMKHTEVHYGEDLKHSNNTRGISFPFNLNNSMVNVSGSQTCKLQIQKEVQFASSLSTSGDVKHVNAQIIIH